MTLSKERISTLIEMDGLLIIESYLLYLVLSIISSITICLYYDDDVYLVAVVVVAVFSVLWATCPKEHRE